MTFVRPKARILERSITSGNGPYALAGAIDLSYNSFSSFMSVGDTTYCSVIEPGVAFWTGIVTYSATNQITLTTVEESKGTFGAGTKEIMSGALASTSMFREDISGAIVTTGSSSAYAVVSNRVYDTLTRLHGNIIAFSPHATNTGPLTLNVDGLGAKPLRTSPGVEVLPASLILGTPYLALYNHTDQVFYLHGFFANPYNVPFLGGMDYWDTVAPNSAFIFPAGQAISRTTYAAAFARWGTTYGSGDGSTTFNVPNKAGRVSAMKETSATLLTSTYFGADSTLLGSKGGGESVALSNSNFPSYTPSGSVSSTGAVPSSILAPAGLAANTGVNASGNPQYGNTIAGTVNISSSFTGSAQGGTNVPVRSVMPAIICEYLIRVL